MVFLSALDWLFTLGLLARRRTAGGRCRGHSVNVWLALILQRRGAAAEPVFQDSMESRLEHALKPTPR